jgi:hypothetical protein
MALCKAVTRCRDPQETRNDGDRMIISASTGIATKGRVSTTTLLTDLRSVVDR